MANWIALQWETESPRILLSRSQRGMLTVEKLISSESVSSKEDASNIYLENQDPENLLDRILEHENLGKGEVVVILGRSDVELRPMQLPPVADNELPELVHFQAMREFHAYDADAPVDFVPLDDDPESPRKVLAALLPSKLLHSIRQFCEKHQWKLRQIVLRPCAAASLWSRAEKRRGSSRNCLLVDLFSGGADISLIASGRPHLLRSMRLSEGIFQKDSASASFLGELRRTVIAARNELHGEHLDAVVLFGTGPVYRRWADQIGDMLQIEVELFDPREEIRSIRISEFLQSDGPSNAALLGATQAAASKSNPFFDFRHPRKKEETTRTSHLMAIGAMTAFLILAMLVAWGFYRKARLESEVRFLAGRVTEMEEVVALAEETRNHYDAFEQWQEDRIYWLGELDWLSRSLPSSEEVLLTNLLLRSGGGVGEMRLEGLTQSGTSVALVEWRLRDDRHRVIGGDKGEDRSRERYPFRFDASVLITDPLELPEAQTPVLESAAPSEAKSSESESPEDSGENTSEGELGEGMFDDLFDDSATPEDALEEKKEASSAISEGEEVSEGMDTPEEEREVR